MQKPRVLVLDDDSSLRSALLRLLSRQGCTVMTAGSIQEASGLAQMSQSIDLALVDLRLPDGDGIEYMKELKKVQPETEVLIFTGNGSIETAVRATQNGAFHFITKPFNVDELLSLVDKALTNKKLKTENNLLRSELHQKYRFDHIIGNSAEIRSVLNVVERVADSDSTVLIHGESGTGKELIAKALHYNSNRSKGAFVPINCGAIPAELLESELFGHIKGAFTGALATRVGRFELADGGTLFLDEIGDMDPLLQVKLLRVLQERTFEPVGSAKSVQIDVRILAATNVNLEEAVAQGRFREDLYYRLNVIPVNIPALRERQTDIPILIDHFITRFNSEKKRNISGFSNEALRCVISYDWPGNIRELENLMERLAILKGEGQIEVSDLPPKYQVEGTKISHFGSLEVPDVGLDFNSAVDDYENRLIMRALEKTGWNRNQAAALLKLNRTTLVEKIKKKGLRPPEKQI